MKPLTERISDFLSEKLLEIKIDINYLEGRLNLKSIYEPYFKDQIIEMKQRIEKLKEDEQTLLEALKEQK